jgi:hypothetical protein
LQILRSLLNHTRLYITPIVLAYDQHGNPIGSSYDYGQDGAYAGHEILIGQLYVDKDFNDKAMQKPIDALQAKGFKVKHVKDEAEFIAKLKSNDYQIAWVICNVSIKNNTLIPALIAFHSAGGAIFLFADNEPYVHPASEFLNKKFGITLTGNFEGKKILTCQKNGHLQAGKFGQHDIFTGINSLFEGNTICHPVYPTSASKSVLATMATATDGNPNIAIYDPPAGSTEGRLCLDCGFTKLYINWDDAGTARYIVNVSCWLAEIDERKYF